MAIQVKWEDMRVGLRVKDIDCGFTGTVYDMHGSQATIKRDDGRSGSGSFIKEAPYNGSQGWIVCKRENYVGSDGSSGRLYHLDDMEKTLIGGELCLATLRLFR